MNFEYEKIRNDMNFRSSCGGFGLDWSNFTVYPSAVAVLTPRTGYSLVFDKKVFHPIELTNGDVEEVAKKYYQELPFLKIPNFPFQDFTLSQIVEISSRVTFYGGMSGYPRYADINQKSFARDELNSDCFKILSYLKFINEEMDQYWLRVYSCQLIGLDTPTFDAYLERVHDKMIQVISSFVARGERPSPYDILRQIGQGDFDHPEYLYDVINLHLSRLGYAAKPGTTDKIIPIPKEEQVSLENMRVIANGALNILSATEEEVPADQEDVTSEKAKRIEKKMDQESFMEDPIY